mmetsp:Transcript_79/g.114  ORF Transcript_79/g.114 Transcript_79/m.114 type:complete len:603 (+) Transcript_79:22-1830(+)|eukprot:CAMPEP_0197310076 /NCGR_PEP_ID=MMETSP0891-20130614/8701_1 /TAXON_ID=44058 ORGANISM="Aureoumbra lagunensis, Strain CCMP1510" /NCGR_SAMPLE_ID=MMETSP0891 /ASSEMBLY_ACC=CAM_ASM_000534 /LENGTH=602 /DNA_ID=CAMNT_0042795551 /DNA_START=31 /DNA_END=1839 /DNA_ORIENTATION=+
MSEEHAADFLVNKELKDFVFDLHDATRRSYMTEEIRRLYEVEFVDMSEKYCDKTPWPSTEAMSRQCIGMDGKADALFLCIYKELAYRHLFAKLKANAQDRDEAWSNYCELFDRLLAQDDLQTQLTPGWVFDILHEFVYQFQSFCQTRGGRHTGIKTSPFLDDEDSPHENIEAFPPDDQQSSWQASIVIGYLHEFAKYATAKKAPSQLHKEFGYFALAARCRLETLLGDYGAAVDCLACLTDPLDETCPLAQVWSCRLNVLYHLGFALLMLERYTDAIKVLDALIAPLARLHKAYGGFTQRALPPASPPPEQVQKSFDRSLGLLALAHHLSSGGKAKRHTDLGIDDASKHAIKEKFADKLALIDQIQIVSTSSEAGTKSLTILASLLTASCPKIIVPAAHSLPTLSSPLKADNPEIHAAADLPSAPVSTSKHGQLDAYNQQIRLFTSHVQHYLRLAKIRSYLQLYTSIGIEKLARFNDASPQTFHAQLIGLKHTMLLKCLPPGTSIPTTGISTTSPATQDEIDLVSTPHAESTSQGSIYATSLLDLHFYVDGDMIHVNEPKGIVRYDDFFIRQINKFRGTTHMLLQKPAYKAPNLVTPAGGRD